MMCGLFCAYITGLCSDDEFMCSNEDCIQYQNKICNDEDDCGDNSDERGCNGRCMKSNKLRFHNAH